MSSAITESIITIAVILAAATTAAVMMQSIYNLDEINTALLDTAKQSISTSFKIVFATNSSATEIKIWLKNVGAREVERSTLEKFSMFLGPRGDVRYIPYNQSNLPSWTYSITNDVDSDSCLDPGETLEVTVTWGEVVSTGDWFVRITSPTGGSIDYTFSIGW